MKKRGRPKKIERNPFIFHSKIRTSKLLIIPSARKYEKSGGGAFYDTSPRDKSINLFHISKDLISEFSQKSTKTGLSQLTFYILGELYYNREQVSLKIDVVARETGYSEAVVRRLISDLIKLSVIKRVSGGLKSDSKYWINPIKIFKGNRYQYVINQAKDENEVSSIFEEVATKKQAALEELTKS